MSRDRGGRRQFKRDLPDPPKKTKDNYMAAIAEVYRALDEAFMVAPRQGDREFVRELTEDVRNELTTQLEPEDDDD